MLIWCISQNTNYLNNLNTFKSDRLKFVSKQIYIYYSKLEISWTLRWKLAGIWTICRSCIRAHYVLFHYIFVQCVYNLTTSSNMYLLRINYWQFTSNVSSLIAYIREPECISCIRIYCTSIWYVNEKIKPVHLNW